MTRNYKPVYPTINSALAAIDLIEGFDSTHEEILAAWAYLIKTGICWSLQGFYGRGATDLIESETISRNGKILV